MEIQSADGVLLFKSLVQNLDMLFCGGQTKGGVVGAQRNFLLVNKVVGNLVGWIIEKPFSHISYRGVFFRMENIHVAKNNEMMLSARYRYIEHIVFPSRSIKREWSSGELTVEKRTIGHWAPCRECTVPMIISLYFSFPDIFVFDAVFRLLGL